MESVNGGIGICYDKAGEMLSAFGLDETAGLFSVLRGKATFNFYYKNIIVILIGNQRIKVQFITICQHSAKIIDIHSIRPVVSCQTCVFADAVIVCLNHSFVQF